MRFVAFALILAGVVLVLALTALRPLVNRLVLDLAQDNPAALQLPFVKEIVREDLGDDLTDPASSDRAQVEFVVSDGDTARSIADRLEADGLLADSRAFVFLAIERQLASSLRVGDYVLRRNLTPDELVSALLDPPVITFVDISLRTGLRLEQITAKLQTLIDLEMDPREFYELATAPPAAQGSFAGGVPVARDLSRSTRHDARGADPADAGQLRHERRPGAPRRARRPRPQFLPGHGARFDRRA
jgi:hypothetical protein